MSAKVIVSWSGGKDCALALYEARQDPNYRVAALLTTVTEGIDRISMHGVRCALLEEQARALGHRLEVVVIPPGCTNEEYGRRMGVALAPYQAQGITTHIFGDLHLQDIRAFREERLAQIGMRACFPLWGWPTDQVAGCFIELGFRAILTCVDTRQLGADFVGRDYDRHLLDELPAGVDPCGENGEFHTFVTAGPILAHRVAVERGEVTMRDGRFAYCDLLPAPVPPVNRDRR
jgi:uncharacterized protein (TIGR00290 family)